MKITTLFIEHIPAILYGESAPNVLVYLHGQGGEKEESKYLAEALLPFGYQVLAVDLPEHGVRKNTAPSFEPWNVLPELRSLQAFFCSQWKSCTLFANSIGAWFATIGFDSTKFRQSFFVSPMVDMEAFIQKMMVWSNVTEAQLEKKKTIQTDFGNPLSWEYLTYVRNLPPVCWDTPLEVLYGEKDHLMEASKIYHFAQEVSAKVTTFADGEHYFHTPEQIDFLLRWFFARIDANPQAE